MEEIAFPDVENRRADLLPGMDDVNTECVDDLAAGRGGNPFPVARNREKRNSRNIIPINPRYQHLAFMIVDEKAADHFGWVWWTGEMAGRKRRREKRGNVRNRTW